MSRTILMGPPRSGCRLTTRAAVKAVIGSSDGLLLMHSPIVGDYKFPGGGVRNEESHEMALARELGEECGRVLTRFGDLLLTVVERRPDATDPDAEFEMVSSYYACRVALGEGRQHLDAYEADLGLTPVTVPVAQALRSNQAVLMGDHPPAWTAREVQVLSTLMEMWRPR